MTDFVPLVFSEVGLSALLNHQYNAQVKLSLFCANKFAV